MRILITTLGLPSHFYPLQPLAIAARAAGHDVAVASGSSLADTVSRLGCKFFRAGANLGDPEIVALMKDFAALSPEAQREFVIERLFGGVFAKRLVLDLPVVFESFRPDLVVSEPTEHVGYMLAELHERPAVKVHFGLLPLRDSHLMLRRPRLIALRTELGLDATDALEGMARPYNFVFASRSYQFPEADVPARTSFFCPRAIDATSGEPLPPWLSQLREQPVVYGSLGTVPSFNARPNALRMLIDAIGSIDVHGIVTCGKNQDPASFGPLPAKVRVERFIPQALVLEHSRAMICHGGYGTTIGALSFGVPLVITPMGADQPEHARRCQALGLAEVLPPEAVTLATLTAALEKVLDEPGYGQRARAFRDELAALPDVDAAVTRLEELVEHQTVE